MGDGALADLFVLEFSAIMAGPYCGQLLAQQGAEVVRVEPLGGAVGRQGGWRYGVDRNKRHLAIDLRTARGLEIACALAQRADVLMQNFRPGAMDRLGLGYDAVSELNPGIVYCSLSGYGDRGPLRDAPGQDLLIQAMSGLMLMVGYDDRPAVPAGTAASDAAAGMLSALGIMFALHERERSGQGQHVKTSLLMSLLSTMPYEVTEHLTTGRTSHRVGSGHALLGATYGGYRTKDGEIVMQGDVTRLASILGAEALAADARFAAGVPDRAQALEAHRQEIRAALEARLMTMTRDAALELLTSEGVWCMPIMTQDELSVHPQLAANEMIVEYTDPEIGQVRGLAPPVTLSRTPPVQPRYPGAVGEHSRAILADHLGLSDDEISTLVEQRVIA